MQIGLLCDTRGTRMRWSPGAVTEDAAITRLDRFLGEYRA